MSSGDLFKVECAAALLAVVRAVQDGENEPTTEGLAAFLAPVTDALEDVIGVAARCLESARR